MDETLRTHDVTPAEPPSAAQPTPSSAPGPTSPSAEAHAEKAPEHGAGDRDGAPAGGAGAAGDLGGPPGTAAGGPATEEQVLEALKHVIDPELGINIVDLGLVYDVEISDEGEVRIEYTLTTMGCPIGPLIEHQMESFLAAVPGVKGVEADMVLRPPWSPEMMSEEAKAALGYF